MAILYFITHPDVQIDPGIAVTEWTLSARGHARMHRILKQPWISSLGAVWCSAERKSRDAARIIADAVGTVPRILSALGENDRSSTGYLPEAEFEATADAFFADPQTSIRGWETAADAQRRIVAAIDTVVRAAPTGRDIAVVSHGGVGALLLCRLKSIPISRAEDQPGSGGGHYYCFDPKTCALPRGWARIDPDDL